MPQRDVRARRPSAANSPGIDFRRATLRTEAPEPKGPPRARARSAATIFAQAALLAAASACGGDSPKDREPDPISPLGSARITWTIRSTSGEILDCRDIGVENVSVALGGTPKVVPCGEEPSVTFTNVLAQRYPVIVQLRVFGTGVLREIRDNIVVEPGRESALDLIFELDPGAGNVGKLRARWRIADQPAATGCALVGGSTVHIEELPGSRDEIDASERCDAGEITLEDVRTGGYGILLQLLDEERRTIATTSIPTVTIGAGQTAMPLEVAFPTSAVERARLISRWTVNGTIAQTGCSRVDADAVVIKAFPESEFVATLTATSACSPGELVIPRVPPGNRRHRVVFQLFGGFFTEPPIPIVLTSTTVRDILFIRGTTSTVTVDLRTPD